MSTKSALRADLDAPLGVVVGKCRLVLPPVVQKNAAKELAWLHGGECVRRHTLNSGDILLTPRFIPRGDHRHRGCGRSVTARRRARVGMSRNEPPPLWSSPAPVGHDGGPPLDILPDAGPPRRPGRPTVSTPELRDRIFERLCFDPERSFGRAPSCNHEN
jgi:hypothetical protein